jgi:uncharacterized protein
MIVQTTKAISINLREFLSPPYLDRNYLGWLLAGQGLVLNVGIFADFLAGMNPIQSFTYSFDKESMSYASVYAMLIILFGQVLDNAPLKVCRDIAMDTRVFVLRIIGRSTPAPIAALAALLMAAAAGFSEEILFRGVIFAVVDKFAGMIPAYAISSLLFGLGHSPVFGANVVLEMLFGAYFAYTYVSSGYNIAVPIAVHTLYDFATIFVTWWLASRDIRKQIKEIRDIGMIRVPATNDTNYAVLTRAVRRYLTCHNSQQSY